MILMKHFKAFVAEQGLKIYGPEAYMEAVMLMRDIVRRACERAVKDKSVTLQPKHFKKGNK